MLMILTSRPAYQDSTTTPTLNIFHLKYDLSDKYRIQVVYKRNPDFAFEEIEIWRH
jgi:hypothetical protein